MRFHQHDHGHAFHRAASDEGGMHRRGHFFHRHHGEADGERGGRFFDQGDLRWVILKLIAEKPSHGYEIIKAIEERLGGAYAPSPGTVYPTLTLLEELGYIAIAETDGPRKLYAVTDAGRTALEQEKATVDAIFAKMAEINLRRSGNRAPQLVRAWGNLKMAMNLRVARGPLAPEQIEKIAQILDDAAKEVEKA
ncbi:MAG: PadR family transcriptional regulator [Methylovirgula sp.]